MEKGMLSSESACLYLDVSLGQFKRWRKLPAFPKPLSIGSDAMQTNKYWSVKSLDKWIASLDPNEEKEEV